jgi:hypothetical protein
MIPPVMPIVQIRQQFAKIGIDADLGTQLIEQPRATMEMKRIPPRQSIEQPRGVLEIDQSKAWDALALCGTLEMLHRIYDQGPAIALETIARIAQTGDRLAAIHLPGDPIPEIAAEQSRVVFGEYQFAGPASYDNVDITYTARKPIIEVQDGEWQVRIQANPVKHTYIRGKLDIYMRQYPSVTFIPPQIDVRV